MANDEVEGKHYAIVRISHELLRQILFPEGTKVLAMMQDVNDIFGREDFVCVVEHPDLPVHHIGNNLLSVSPIYRQNYNGGENEIATVTFEGWGI